MQRKLIKNLLLVVAMVVLCFAVGMSASALEPTGQCGDNVYWNYDEITGELVISGEGEVSTYDFRDCSDIKRIIIKDGITSTIDGAFSSCYSVTEIIVGKDLKSFGPSYGCFDLEKITVDKENQWLCSDDKGVLYTKDKSKLILYPCASSYTTYEVDKNTSEIEGFAFMDCQYLEDITLPYGLKRINPTAFAYSSSFKSITLPETVEYIGFSAFLNLVGLESVVITSNSVEIQDDETIDITEKCFITYNIINKDEIGFIKEFFKTPSSEITDEMYDKLNSSIISLDEPTYFLVLYCHADSTTEAYAVKNNIPYELTHFYEDEWTYDYDNLVKYRKCIHCDELETEAIEPELPTEPDTPATPDEEIKDDFFSKIFELIKAFIDLLFGWINR